MDIASIRRNISEYTEEIDGFFNTAIDDREIEHGDICRLLDATANTFLQPLRVCLTALQGRKVLFLDEGYIVKKERYNLLTKYVVCLVVICPFTYFFYKSVGLYVNMDIEARIAESSFIKLLRIALAIHITVIHLMFILAVAWSCLLTIAGVALKKLVWSSDSHVVNRYREYLSREQLTYDHAVATRNHKALYLKAMVIDEKMSSNRASFIEAIPIEVALSVNKYLKNRDVFNFRLVSKKCANIGSVFYYELQRDWFAKYFSVATINQAGIENLVAYPQLCVPYNACWYKGKLQIQRCGSTDYSENIERLRIEDLGDCDVRWGLMPRPFIAMKKIKKHKFFTCLAHVCGIRVPTFMQQYRVKVCH